MLLSLGTRTRSRGTHVALALMSAISRLNGFKESKMVTSMNKNWSPDAVLAAIHAGIRLSVHWTRLQLESFLRRLETWALSHGIRIKITADASLESVLIGLGVGGAIGAAAGFVVAGGIGAIIGIVVGGAVGTLVAHCHLSIQATDNDGYDLSVAPGMSS